MTTVTGTLVLPDATPDRGVVAFRSYVTAPNGVDLVTTAPVLGVLDDLGAFSVEVIDSEDPSWDLGGEAMPYQVTIATQGERSSFLAYITGNAINLVDLVPLVDVPDLYPGLPVAGDHGGLTGLGDDDHAQYLNAERLDALRSFHYVKTVDLLDIPNAWTEAARLVTPDLDAGTYEWGVAITLLYDAQNRLAEVRFSTDDGQTWGPIYGIEPPSAVDRFPFTYGYPFEHPGGVRTVLMEIRKSSTQGVLDMPFLDLWYRRVY